MSRMPKAHARQAAVEMTLANLSTRVSRANRPERVSLSPQSTWGAVADERLGDGFSVRSRP